MKEWTMRRGHREGAGRIVVEMCFHVNASNPLLYKRVQKFPSRSGDEMKKKIEKDVFWWPMPITFYPCQYVCDVNAFLDISQIFPPPTH